ncbi:MAG: hypothetical protein PHI18_00160 [bacterium]|nr:hypothetical protein [bacterium]
MGLTPLQIEAAIATTLKSALVPDYFRAVEQYNGKVGNLDELATWICEVKIPALAVFGNGNEGDPNARTETGWLARCEEDFEVWILTDRLRDLKVLMQGAKGVYDLSQAVYATLLNNRCGQIEMEPLQFVRDGVLLGDEKTGRLVWQMIWRTSYARSTELPS